MSKMMLTCSRRSSTLVHFDLIVKTRVNVKMLLGCALVYSV